MPPLAADPRHNRRWFAALRELAFERWPSQRLSMGTSQDFAVAVAGGGHNSENRHETGNC